MLYNIPYHEIDKVKKSNRQEKIDLINKLFNILQINHIQQDIEINEALSRQKRFTDKFDFIFSNVDVLYGSIIENDVATIFQSYQLNPFFTNTVGQVINFTDGYKMKSADIAVKSLKNNLLYGFDVKYGTVWRKHTDNNNFYLTNSGIYPSKLNEIRKLFKEKLIKTYNMPTDKVYLLFVCYDCLSTVNYLGQADIYKNVFHSSPNNIQKVMFVVDVDKLFKTITDEFEYEVFDKTSSYIIDNYLSTNQYYYLNNSGEHQYSIKINSDITIPLDKFINNYLIDE